MTQRIYFDESGYTGSHYFDAEQPHFVYVGVAMDEVEAMQIMADIPRKKSQEELKASTLLRTEKGRNYLMVIADKIIENCYICVYEKRYAVMLTLFEYFFEPIIRHSNKQLYANGFHRFIAGLLYMSSILDEKVWESFWTDLRQKVGEPNSISMDLFLPFEKTRALIPDVPDPMAIVFDLILANREIILEDMMILKNDNVLRRWFLDVSLSALHCANIYFTDCYKKIEVICDDSKPLKQCSKEYMSMIDPNNPSELGLDDPHYLRKIALSKPIVFKKFKGLQRITGCRSSCWYYTVCIPQSR